MPRTVRLAAVAVVLLGAARVRWLATLAHAGDPLRRAQLDPLERARGRSSSVATASASRRRSSRRTPRRSSARRGHVGKPGPPLRLDVTAGRARGPAARPASRAATRDGKLAIPIPTDPVHGARHERSASATTAAAPSQLVGVEDALRRGIELNGERQAGRCSRSAYRRAGEESAFAPAADDRAPVGVAKTTLAGSWTMWALAAIVLLASALALALVRGRDFGRARAVTRHRGPAAHPAPALRRRRARGIGVPRAAWLCALIAVLNAVVWSLLVPPFQSSTRRCTRTTSSTSPRRARRRAPSQGSVLSAEEQRSSTALRTVRRRRQLRTAGRPWTRAGGRRLDAQLAQRPGPRRATAPASASAPTRRSTTRLWRRRTNRLTPTDSPARRSWPDAAACRRCSPASPVLFVLPVPARAAAGPPWRGRSARSRAGCSRVRVHDRDGQPGLGLVALSVGAVLLLARRVPARPGACVWARRDRRLHGRGVLGQAGEGRARAARRRRARRCCCWRAASARWRRAARGVLAAALRRGSDGCSTRSAT